MTLLYTPWLCTLDQVRQHQSLLNVVAEQKDNALLRKFIAEASAEFCEDLDRIPMPYLQTRQQFTKSGRLLKFDEDLLEIISLTYGTTTVDTSQYGFMPANSYPKAYLSAERQGCSGFPFWPSARGKILLNGVWGYVPHYPRCWKDSGVALTATLADTQIPLTVTSDDAALLDVGMYLKTFDVSGEVMQVTDIRDEIITLSRGELGTTAAAHVGTSPSPIKLFRYVQREDISGAVIEKVVYKYKAKDRIGGRVVVLEGGSVGVLDMEKSVYDTIERHRREEAFQA